jgi:hypothetical protein
VTRWVIMAADPVRTLYRGCQRIGYVLRWCDRPLRQRFQYGCFIADINVLELVIMTRWVIMAADPLQTLYRGCQCSGYADRDGATGH